MLTILASGGRRDQAHAVAREVIKLNEIMVLLLHTIFPAAYVPRVLQGDSSIAERFLLTPPSVLLSSSKAQRFLPSMLQSSLSRSLEKRREVQFNEVFSFFRHTKHPGR